MALAVKVTDKLAKVSMLTFGVVAERTALTVKVTAELAEGMMLTVEVTAELTEGIM